MNQQEQQRRRLGLAVLTGPLTGDCLRLHVWRREPKLMDGCSVIQFEGATNEDVLLVAARLRKVTEQVELDLLEAVAQRSRLTVDELREVVTQTAAELPGPDSITRVWDLPAGGGVGG